MAGEMFEIQRVRIEEDIEVDMVTITMPLADLREIGSSYLFYVTRTAHEPTAESRAHVFRAAITQGKRSRAVVKRVRHEYPDATTRPARIAGEE